MANSCIVARGVAKGCGESIDAQVWESVETMFLRVPHTRPLDCGIQPLEHVEAILDRCRAFFGAWRMDGAPGSEKCHGQKQEITPKTHARL